MTLLQYLLSTGVCSTKELLELKREHPADYELLVAYAREQATANNVELTTSK